MPAIGAIIGAVVVAVTALLYRLSFYLVPKIVKWVLLSLGIGFVTYQGIDMLLDYIMQKVVESMTSLPGAGVQVLTYVGIFDGVNLIFSSLVAAVTFKIGSSYVKKFKFYA